MRHHFDVNSLEQSQSKLYSIQSEFLLAHTSLLEISTRQESPIKGEKDLNDLELVGLKYEDEGLYSEMTEE